MNRHAIGVLVFYIEYGGRITEYNLRDYTVWGFKMWLLAALMSDRVNKGFPVDKKMSVRLAELLKSGHNNEVAVRQGSAVHPIIYYDYKFSHVVVA